MIPIGTPLMRFGAIWTVAAVGYVGERYYWLTKNRTDGQVVSMVPAADLEAEWDANKVTIS